MKLAQRMAGMELSLIPVWVIDPEPMRILWGNSAAVKLWRAQDEADLLARDLAGAPANVVTRTQAIVALIRKGQATFEEWTLYPRGVPTPVKLHLSGVPLDDGRIGMLNQAMPSELAQQPTLLRGIEALHHTTVRVALVSPSGDILYQNAAALSVFGLTASWLSWFVDVAAARAILDAALAGEVVHQDLMVRTPDGERCYAIGAHATHDPVSGATVVLTHQTDETVRVSAVRTVERQGHLIEELNTTLELVERQRQEILALSVPILDVGAHTIAVPLIGELDEARCAEIADRLLGAIVNRRARHVILDLTGAATSDVAGSSHLLRILAALRLLGAHAILSGIRPTLARHLVDSGLALNDFQIVHTLAQGLIAAGLAKGTG